MTRPRIPKAVVALVRATAGNFENLILPADKNAAARRL